MPRQYTYIDSYLGIKNCTMPADNLYSHFLLCLLWDIWILLLALTLTSKSTITYISPHSYWYWHRPQWCPYTYIFYILINICQDMFDAAEFYLHSCLCVYKWVQWVQISVIPVLTLIAMSIQSTAIISVLYTGKYTHTHICIYSVLFAHICNYIWISTPTPTSVLVPTSNLILYLCACSRLFLSVVKYGSCGSG